MLTPQEEARFQALKTELFPETTESNLSPEEEARFQTLKAELRPEETRKPKIIADLLPKQPWDNMTEGEWEAMTDRPLVEAGKQKLKGVRNAAASLGDVADIPSFIANLSGANIPYVGHGIAEGIDTATGGLTAPENDSERVIESVTRGLGSMVATGGAASVGLAKGIAKEGGKAHKLLNFLKESGAPVKSNIVPTAAAAGVTQAALNHDPDNRLAALIAGLIAGGSTNAVMNAGSLNKARNLSINPDKVKLLKDTDTPLTLNAVSDSPAVHRSYNAARNSPWTGKEIHEREAAQLQSFENVFGLNPETAKNYSPNRGGDLAMDAIDRHKPEVADKIAGTQSNIIRDEVATWAEQHGEPIVNVDRTISYLESERDSLITAPRQKAFDESIEGQVLTELKSTWEDYKGMPLNALSNLKRGIADKVKTFGKLGKETEKKVEYLSGQLTNDMYDFIREVSPEAKEALRLKNEYWTGYAKDVRPHFNEIIGALHDAPQDRFQRIFTESAKTSKKLDPLYQVFTPAQKEEFTKTFLTKLGQNRKNEFNIATMASKFRGLPEETQKVLLSPYKEATRKKIPKVLKIVRNLEESSKSGNSSGTAFMQNTYDIAKDTAEQSVDFAWNLLDGKPVAAVSKALRAGVKVAVLKLASKNTLLDENSIDAMYKAMIASPQSATKNVHQLSKLGKMGRLILSEAGTLINNIK